MASPLYCAEIGLLPSGSDDVVTVATPFAMVPVPSVVAPLVNDTLPVALLGRVAVKVTDWLNNDGFAEEARVIVGVALLTAWTSEATELLLLLSPL